MDSNSLAKIATLTINPSCVLQHPTHKSELTKQTMFSTTRRRDMRLGQNTDRQEVVHDLHDWICVGVENVGFQTTEFSLVVEPVSYISSSRVSKKQAYAKSKSSTPNFEYSISTLR